MRTTLFKKSCKRTADRTNAIKHLQENLQGSRIFEAIGTPFSNPEYGEMTLVTASKPPINQDFSAGWAHESNCIRDWLIECIIYYLADSSNGLVLFADIVSSPSDLAQLSAERPAFWSYDGTVFWPVLKADAQPNRVEEIKAWSAAFREICVFGILPNSLLQKKGDVDLSPQSFGQIASSTFRIITDVFDGDGYLDWRQRK